MVNRLAVRMPPLAAGVSFYVDDENRGLNPHRRRCAPVGRRGVYGIRTGRDLAVEGLSVDQYDADADVELLLHLAGFIVEALAARGDPGLES
jgi:hypothetical protein